MRTFAETLPSGRKRALLFGLMVFLPSLFIGLLTFRAFQGEESRQQFQRKERQHRIVRSLETELNNSLFSLQSQSGPGDTVFKFQAHENEILLPALNVTISSYRPRKPLLLSTEELRLWQETQNAGMQRRTKGSLRETRAAYQHLVNRQPRLAPLARLALLRLALEEKDFNDTDRWLNLIQKNDDQAFTESGIPISVAAGLLLAQGNLGCGKGGSLPASEFLHETLGRLVDGHWRLTGTQWALYAGEIAAGLQSCEGQSQKANLSRAQRISKLIHPLLDAYPQVLALAQSLADGAPLEKKYFPELDSFIVVIPGPERPLGYIVGRQSLEELAAARLADLTAAEDFTGRLVRTDRSGQDLPVDMEVMGLNSFSPFQVSFIERHGSGGLLNIRKHFFSYSLVLLLVVAVMGIVFTYHTVSHEVEVARLKSDFIAAVSHEFRSPLTSMSTLLERLDSGRVRDDEMLKRYHRVIRQELHRLSLLIDGLLDFTRFEEGKKDISLEPSNLIHLARDTVSSFHNLGHTDRVSFVESEPGLPLVSADPAAITQCIQNLIDNAIKYSPNGTPVLVQTGREDGEIFLEVSDRGLGIPASEQPRIFEQFYRARHTNLHNVKGAGMGLALVKRIMEKHGGRVTLDSQPGEGSRFRLVFPPDGVNRE
jgi:signal transduction histidine kinase